MSDANQVWVIDDDRSIRWVLERALSKADMDVTSFSNGVGIMESLEREQPDVVISDVRMPGIDGLDLLRWMRASDERVQVVMMTGHGDVSFAVQAMKAGARDFLTKPAPLASIASRVSSKSRYLPVPTSRRERYSRGTCSSTRSILWAMRGARYDSEKCLLSPSFGKNWKIPTARSPQAT